MAEATLLQASDRGCSVSKRELLRLAFPQGRGQRDDGRCTMTVVSAVRLRSWKKWMMGLDAREDRLGLMGSGNRLDVGLVLRGLRAERRWKVEVGRMLGCDGAS